MSGFRTPGAPSRVRIIGRMPRARLVRWFLGGVLAALPAIDASPSHAGPRPTDPRDAMLLARAERVGRNVVERHLTPEGLLAYIHRRDATPAQLSHDCLDRADTAIWSGCYAASVACRYHVSRDAASLALARRVAAGLEMLSKVTGVEGAIARSAGRAIPGEPLGPKVVPSPLGGGFMYRRDASRDALSGIVLGWTCLAKFVDDAEVRYVAGRNLEAIARRLYKGGMAVREPGGEKTKHGDIDAHVGPFENGSHAAIGSAAILAGARFSGAQDLWDAWDRLCDKGWDDAIDGQQTWVGGKVLHASNVNMAHHGLLVVALLDEGRAKRNAMAALREFRRASDGWGNAGLIAMALLAGQQVSRDESVAELRRTLLAMPAQEVPWKGTWIEERRGPVPFDRRPINCWAWKQDANREEMGRETAVLDPKDTFTRADYLFAYWLARAAGELTPGPADPTLPPPPGPTPSPTSPTPPSPTRTSPGAIPPR